ncbi:MAG: hypothetical protein KUL88_13510 [Rhizobium sp.]|nr:hypothetical protein [Rhizobium sp.]
MRRFFALAALAIAALAPCFAFAGQSRLESIDTTIAGTGTTYLDLARAFVPNLAADGMNWKGRTLDAEFAGRFELDEDWPDGLEIGGVETLAIDRAGRRALAVLYDFGTLSNAPQGPAILAVYTLEAEPRLVGSVDVGLDRETHFADPPLLDLGDGTTLLVARSAHWNSSQSYSITSLVLATDDGLSPVDTILTFSERLCGLNRTQEPIISVDKTGERPALRVEVTIREEKVEESCDTEPVPAADRIVSTTYRLNENGVYEPDSDALEVLARENEQRF